MSPVQAPPSATQDELRELASFRAVDGLVLSLTIGFDPSVVPTGDETATRLGSLLEQARRTAGERLDRTARLALDDDLARVRDEAPRRLGPAGLAFFADSADGLWRVVERRAPLPDLAVVGSAPYLVPLAAAPAEERALVAAVGRERGEIFELRDGKLEQLADLSEDQPRRHHAGHSWHQPSLEAHVDELARAHLRRVATSLDGLARARAGVPVVVAGEQKQAAAFLAVLVPETRDAVVDVVHPEAHAKAPDLLPLVCAALERLRDQEESGLVERWSEADGRGQGAVHGWNDTLAAASDGRIETLLFREGAARPVYVCRTCGRAQAAAGSCPLDGRPLEEADGVDVAIRLTLANGGRAQPVRRRDGLDPVGGIGALLNF